MEYRVRPATLDDLETLVHHRVAMFTDMGIAVDEQMLRGAFERWLRDWMPSGAYRGWLVEDDEARIAGGGGATIIPWPPGPQYPSDKLAFVYNVYVEPQDRRRGVARLIMGAIHTWCRANGVASVALNASSDGRPLYESMGYSVMPNPMMFFAVVGV